MNEALPDDPFGRLNEELYRELSDDEQVTALFRLKKIRDQYELETETQDEAVVSAADQEDFDPDEIIIDEGWLE